MSIRKVFITRQIPAEGIQLLSDRGYHVDLHSAGSAPSREQMLAGFREADAVITLLSDTVDRELMQHSPHLKIIANYAVGFNNIDLQAAKELKIMVTNTPDILTAATADLTWALLLAVSKRVVEGDRYVRNGKFSGWGPLLMLGGDVTGKTIGIVGAGRIGQAVARRARGFEMNILYHSPRPKADFEQQVPARYCGFDTLIAEADYISFHCPLTEQTHHLLNRNNIYQVKKNAYIINTARGPVIEESALIDALKSGHLAGAGLDVYEFEPRLSPGLTDLPNVVLLPHVGSGTTETRREMALMAARNIIAVLEEGRALNPVF